MPSRIAFPDPFLCKKTASAFSYAGRRGFFCGAFYFSFEGISPLRAARPPAACPNGPVQRGVPARAAGSVPGAVSADSVQRRAASPVMA